MSLVTNFEATFENQTFQVESGTTITIQFEKAGMVDASTKITGIVK